MTITEQAKGVCDVLSVMCIGATLTAILPPIAALVSIFWGVIRIYETRTVQKYLGRQPMTRASDREET